MLSWLVVITFISAVQGNSEAKLCPEYPRLYIELGCTADYSGDEQCPNNYVCPDFISLNPNQCHYNGNSYDIEQYLKTEENPKCRPSCKCSGNGYSTYFHCPQKLCPYTAPKEGCVSQNSIDQCCDSDKFVCGEEANTLPTCTFMGKTYKKGNIMYNSNGCYKCLCDENFDNSTDYQINENCQRVICDIQINTLYNFQKGCIPIFYEDYCCPASYRCPNDDDSIIQTSNRIETQGTCKFGNLTLHAMDKLNIDRKCVECTCFSPPMVQCILKKGCDLGPIH